MSNQDLEGFLLQKIQALKNEETKVDKDIDRVAGPYIAKKAAIRKEVATINTLIKDFKNGVDPLAEKPPVKRGGRKTATT